jgi:Skp family chaperone for outer membrane proteins
MNDWESIKSKDGEELYENLRNEVLLKISKPVSERIEIKAHTSKVLPFPFRVRVFEQKLRESIVSALEENEIPFLQDGKQIQTTLSGVSQISGVLPSEKQTELLQIEKKIHQKFHDAYGLDAFVRVDAEKEYKWAARGEKLSNTYYFRNLEESEAALQKGYLKSTYEPSNLTRWQFPNTKPQHWELPNTMKQVIEPPEKSPTIIIDGGDELAMALSSSGIPDLVAYGIQATLLYPFFLTLLRIGYEGGSSEEKEHKELLDENLDAKKELRQKLIESLIRETKIKEELNQRWDRGEECKGKSPMYRLVSALSKEGVLRESMAMTQGKRSKEAMSAIQTETQKIEKELAGLISKETLEKLSDKIFYKRMIQKGHLLAESKESYAKFIDDLSAWKQNSDKTFVRKLQRYVETQALKTGMGWMWTALAVFEANAIMNTIGSTGVKIPAREAVDTVLESTAGIMAAAGQSAMIVYGMAKTYGGLKTVMTLSDWIQKINQSELIDANSKQLVAGYLRSKRTHALLGDCLGSSLLSCGQLMMVLGGPAGGLGSAVTFPGAGITILGVGITLTNNLISANKFRLLGTPNQREEQILKDNLSLLPDGAQSNESHYSANLRWKAKTLIHLSSQKEEKLLWTNIRAHIIKSCEKLSQPNLEEAYQKAAEKVMEKVLNTYSYRFTGNMQKRAKESFSKRQTKTQIIEMIKVFYQDRMRFYRGMIEGAIEPQSQTELTSFLENQPSAPVAHPVAPPVAAHAHPQYKEVLALLKTLKEAKLWHETERKLLKRLIIQKKSEQNIRGSYFEPYIKILPVKENRYIEIPSPIPLLDIHFKNPLFPMKKKTVYIFREDAFLHDLEHYESLSLERKNIIEDLMGSLLKERKNAVGKALVTEGQLKMKSDVYRPLWIQIPQLVYKEQIAREATQSKEKETARQKGFKALGRSRESYDQGMVPAR